MSTESRSETLMDNLCRHMVPCGGWFGDVPIMPLSLTIEVRKVLPPTHNSTVPISAALVS
jgi:hypothetical protein